MKIILENKSSTFEIRKLQNLIEKCSDKFNFMKHSKYIFWDSWAKLVEKSGRTLPNLNLMTIFINIAPIENIQNLVMCDQFSVNKMTIFINSAPIEKYSNCGNVRPIFRE